MSCSSCNRDLKTDEVKGVEGDVIYASFEAPKDNLIHIIWNIFICDKYQKIDNNLINENGIGYIISILPRKEEFEKYINPELVEHDTIEYFDKHEEKIDDKLLEIYKEQCEKIEMVRKRKEKRNIIIFCNNGFQRSIPFICYYLKTYHEEEYPMFSNILELILSKMSIDKDLLGDYIKLVEKILN